ncbi:hypothetical protein Agub_g9162 [Astrephomene gubernaculifera]|uniref:Protein kinase domain-containing protein n=1 Tax=Astrephomene gubernaculifera TaxID=47775 RepID=A0AAD3DUP4_9CHLO|nr:hypothetical protein Agub_g9162 [Astrephomene gubernaculifera]
MVETVQIKLSEEEPVSASAVQKQVAQVNRDLAHTLFNKNPALASVVRDLQERNKRAQQEKEKEAATGCQVAADAVDQDTGPTTDIELGNGRGLWVVGGASTVADCKTALEKVGADPKGAAEQHQPAGITSDIPEEFTVQPKDISTGVHLAREGRSAEALKRSFRDLADIVRLYPTAWIVPLAVFFLLTGLGVWGVISGAHSHVQQRKDDARSRAVDAATGFQIQLQQSFTPGVTFQLLVKQRPEWDYWLANFNQTAEELMSRVPNGSLWNLQLQPFAQVMMMHPFRPEDLSQVVPPRDLLGDPTRRDDILRIIQTKEQLVVGPFYLVQGFTGAFIRYPIYVQDVGANETFGFRYRDNATAIPYSDLPASVRSCSVCYNAATREKWWGLLTVLVNYDEVTRGKDSYLVNLRDMGFHYALVRPINDTYEQVIAQFGDSTLIGEDAVTVEVKVVNAVWYLRVAPANGFKPSWQAPLIAAVVIIALIMSLLLFVSLASFKRQRVLLRETVAANLNLAETTKRLEEEKERMDLLLLRQYDLLRCLDANRSNKKDGSSDAIHGGSKRAMMARIEDARRSLNVVKTSVEDPIQVFEVLGAGAFGKVQRGLWRGTVVAVKTMILPANMTGQQKREKMAVMEAAISSSLVHPNIVTTYTYFIRPYHEPTHEGVQQMAVTSQGSGGGGSQSRATDPHGSMDDSTASEGTIHSYEVRLVLEFCDKGSLKDALDQHAFMQGGSLNLAAMLETAADIAKAMVHMHAANVLHSDLKARNIMLKSSGTEGRGVTAKVADFGLSTRMEHQETHLSACFQGTLTHMAPEVMLEGRISKAADVYSFGILLWELFCAADPFAGVPRAHMGHAITKEARRPRFPPFAPRSYVDLASRCWDPDASARPSFEQVLTELVRIREEMGGDTPPLVIAPPKPVSISQQGGHGFAAGGQHGGSSAGGGAAGRLDDGGAGGNVDNNNPLVLYNAGIVVGGASTVTGGSMPGGAAGGGCASAHGGGSTGVAGATHSSMAQRAMIKSSMAMRHWTNMGIRVGGGGSSGMGQTLPALSEESEQSPK